MLRSRSVHRSGKTLLLIVLGLLVTGLAAAFAFPSGVKKLIAAVTGKEEDAGAGFVLRMAEKGPFRIMITENGTALLEVRNDRQAGGGLRLVRRSDRRV